MDIVHCGECIFWQKPQVKLPDGTYRDYKPEEYEMVDVSVGINCGSYCAKYDRYHINHIPQFMSEEDFCSKGYRINQGESA